MEARTYLKLAVLFLLLAVVAWCACIYCYLLGAVSAATLGYRAVIAGVLLADLCCVIAVRR